MIGRHLKKSFVIFLLFAGIIMAASGYIDKPIQWLGMEKVSKSNKTYLKDSFDKSVTGFVSARRQQSGRHDPGPAFHRLEAHPG